MKVEVAESLVASWLRHEKGCQLVQMNWKANSAPLRNLELLERLFKYSRDYFLKKNISIYSDKVSLYQLLRQAEIDVLGVELGGTSPFVYAADVAFHENGLNYGSEAKCVARVIKKCVRSAMCIYTYLGVADAEVVFASPVIGPELLNQLKPHFPAMEELLAEVGIPYQIRLIANQDFSDLILNPVLTRSRDVADTSELFLRSVQLLNLFGKQNTRRAVTAMPTAAAIPGTSRFNETNDDHMIEDPRNNRSQETLSIVLKPSTEAAFKEELLKKRVATIHIYYRDGRVDTKRWPAEKFSANSGVLNNLRSRPEFRRGEWQRRNIDYVEVTVGDSGAAKTGNSAEPDLSALPDDMRERLGLKKPAKPDLSVLPDDMLKMLRIKPKQ